MERNCRGDIANFYTIEVLKVFYSRFCLRFLLTPVAGGEIGAFLLVFPPERWQCPRSLQYSCSPYIITTKAVHENLEISWWGLILKKNNPTVAPKENSLQEESKGKIKECGFHCFLKTMILVVCGKWGQQDCFLPFENV